MEFRNAGFIGFVDVESVCFAGNWDHELLVQLVDAVGRIVSEPGGDGAACLNDTDRLTCILNRADEQEAIFVDVTEHIEANGLLIAIEQGSESLSVLVTALIRNVAKQHRGPPLLLCFTERRTKELNHAVGIVKLVPKHKIVEITALCVQ